MSDIWKWWLFVISNEMWVTRCIFLRSSTFYHVNLEKSKVSCLDMSFSKVRTNGGNKVFKLDVQFFHQKQPNCVLDLQEATTKNEEKKLSSQNWGRCRSGDIAPEALALQYRPISRVLGGMLLAVQDNSIGELVID